MKKYFAEIIICLLIIVSALAVYAQLRGYDYILYDDILSIYGPCAINGLSTKERGKAFFKMTHRLPYQVPIPAVVRLALLELFGDDIGKHHLFSAWLHITCALLLFLFLRSATERVIESGFCALVFTVHPINVEPVSWLAGYNGMIEAFFLMIALVCYNYYIKKPSFKRYLLVFPPFILGLMSKPTMAILPFLLFLLDYWPFQRFRLDSAGRRDLLSGFCRNKIIIEKLPFIVLIPTKTAIENLIISGRLWHQGSASFNFHPGSIVDLIFYIRKVFYPVELTICRPSPAEASLWSAAGVGAVLLMISVWILWKAHSRSSLITGWFWFLAASSPVMLMVFLTGRPVAARHFYIPLIGIFIMISFGLPSLIGRRKTGRYLLAAAGISAVLLLTFVAHLQTGHWKNSVTVFNHAISIYPDNKKAHANLGDAYMKKDEFDKAIHHFRQLLRISPDSARGHTKLANALALVDRKKEAIRHYKRAIALSPQYAPAYHGFADLLISMRKTDKAITYYKRALEIDSHLFQTLNNLALALYEQGECRKALSYLEQAIRINPRYRTAIVNRRLIRESLGEKPCTRP